MKFRCQVLFFFCFSVLNYLAGATSVIEDSVRLKWSIQEVMTTEQRITTLTFENAHHTFFEALPTLCFRQQGAYAPMLVRQVSYQPLTAEEKQYIDTTLITTQLRHDQAIGYARKVAYTTFYLLPLRRNPATQQLEKAIQIHYTLTPQAVRKTPAQHQTTSGDYAENSALAQGTWYKLGVTQTGIYKLTYSYLQSIGVPVSEINPNHIKIYGYGGGMLPEPNATSRPDDMKENAIWVEGAADNVFNLNDYVLFYGRAPDVWRFAGNNRFTHTKNIYSDTTYYFLHISPTNGLRVPTENSLTTPTNTTITTFDDYVAHHRDLFNIMRSGREWFGERFDFILEYNFSFSLPGAVPNTNMRLTVATLVTSTVSTNFTATLNGQPVGTINVPGMPITDFGLRGRRTVSNFNVPVNNLNTANLNLRLNYNKNGNSTAIGYLDFIEIQLKRNLQLYGSQTTFRSVEQLNDTVVSFSVGNANSHSIIWNVTNPTYPFAYAYELRGNVAEFTTYGNPERPDEFIIFDKTAPLLQPVSVSVVANQNLHGLATPELLIITHPQFLPQAQQLAHFRRTHDKLEVAVVTPQQIYNEFSSGQQDLTALRDFIRMLYRRDDKIKYVLLFGDASYDYKNRIPNNTNFVPIFQTPQSLLPIQNMCSDDYIGFLDDNEGLWYNSEGNLLANQLLDVAIGRLPVKTAAEAQQVVNKIIHYSHSPAAMGSWRSRLTLIADNGDGGAHHDTFGSENLLRSSINLNSHVFNINKIYVDAFPLVSTPSGQVAPLARQALNNAVLRGSLIKNYNGHGNPFQWASEQLLEISQIEQWDNYDKLPLFITATCDFGVYDDPGIVSGGEKLLLSPIGGGIGVITAARAVFANTNFQLNNEIYKSFFGLVNNYLPPRMGDIMATSKNAALAGNQNYALLGDPSLSLAYPQEKVVVTAINQMNVADVQLQALGLVTLQGEVRNRQTDTVLTHFNGIADITVFDKESDMTTLGLGMSYKLRKDILYAGKTQVINGKFEVVFIVPKDISYVQGDGKISIYAYDTTHLIDAAGVNLVQVGGTYPNPAIDTVPPVVRVFINDESTILTPVQNRSQEFAFREGVLSCHNPVLFIELEDESGINLSTTGIGREITAVLNGRTDAPILLNEFYTSELGNFRRGTIRYPLQQLAAGEHTLQITAWDTYNNANDVTIRFTTLANDEIVLKNLRNYPNPFYEFTTFAFEHNACSGQSFEVIIEIFNLAGQLVGTLQKNIENAPAYVGSLEDTSLRWNGKHANGSVLPAGMYIYKITLKTANGKQTQKTGKLIYSN